MSDVTNASYTFLPWLQRGLAVHTSRVDGDNTRGARAQLPVTLTLGTSEGDKNANVNLELVGPGDIKGIDPRVIIRRYPAPGERNAAANYFPSVEFDQPDFPWRHTPARANSKDRLRPWLVLIVLLDEEIASEEAAGADGRLPAITVKSAASLPLPGQSWAWAHVQVSGLQDGTADKVQQVLESEPDRALARLLCPRRLLPRLAYTAFLVPAFERGRRAGLGEPLDDIVDALEPAWTGAASNIRLPVYDQWQFQTGAAGDFESLARQFKPWQAPANLGTRLMDVSEPGPGLPAVAAQPLAMEGALMSPAARQQQTPGIEAEPAFVTKLTELVNTPADLLETGVGDPIVAPPLYGRWYAGRDRLAPQQAPHWFNDMNSDPRFRAACGLGTRTIQEQQEQLLASAWDQVEGILKLQEKYRQAQLSRELAHRVREKNLFKLDTETAILVTSSMHTQVRGSPHTIHAALQRSPIAAGIGDGQFRRLSRPFGPTGKRQARFRQGSAEGGLLARMNRGELRPAPLPVTPEELVTVGKIFKDAAPGWLSPWMLKLLGKLPALLNLLAIVVLAIAFLAAPVSPVLVSILAGAAASAAGASVWASRVVRRLRLKAGLNSGVLSPEDIRRTPIPSGFVPLEARPGDVTRPVPPPGFADTETARTAAMNFRSALAELHAQLGTPPLIPEPLVSVNIPEVRSKVLAASDPHLTIALPLLMRTRMAEWMVWDYKDDPIEPPMPAPRFDQPMYESLKALSQEWILPGVGELPANSVSLLVTNQRFVEAYMVGCNHETTRTLRYHEYPIDQRGTYFRQFWDVRGYVPPEGETLDAESLRDIKPVHEWRAAARLGANTARRPPPGGDHLVMVVKGDLFRRYPNTRVYACKARLGVEADGPGNKGKRILASEQKHPVFWGRLDPDVRFFAFELTAAQARGSASPGPDGDHGWFFVLQEQVNEPLFGLDEPDGYGRQVTSWDNLTWGDLVSGAEGLSGLTCINLDANYPDTRLMPVASGAVWHAESGLGTAGASAADLAFITLQKPFRAGIHARDLIV